MLLQWPRFRVSMFELINHPLLMRALLDIQLRCRVQEQKFNIYLNMSEFVKHICSSWIFRLPKCRKWQKTNTEVTSNFVIGRSTQRTEQAFPYIVSFQITIHSFLSNVWTPIGEIFFSNSTWTGHGNSDMKTDERCNFIVNNLIYIICTYKITDTQIWTRD
jgi:hypothetical protein